MGSTGQTLRGLHDFVFAKPFESRPKAIFLESVAGLDRQRAVEGHRVASTLIEAIFDPLSYLRLGNTEREGLLFSTESG
eukprot:11228023-Lingulodinium_polyedra.AAC.1